MEALIAAAPAASANRATARGLLRVEDISPEFKKLTRVVDVTRSDVDFLRASLIQQGAQQLGKAGVGPGASGGQAGQVAQLHLDVRNARDSISAAEIDLREVSGRIAVTEDAIRDLASQWDCHRKEDAKTSGNAFDKFRVQAEAMDIRIEAGKGELNGRVEEVWGFVRAMDEDQTTARKTLAETRERLVVLSGEVLQATRAEPVYSEINATKETLLSQLALQRQELEGSACEQNKALSERQAKSLAEINRVVKAVDQRLQMTRKENLDSQQKFSEKYSEREAHLTTELHARVRQSDLDKALTKITELFERELERERCRSEQERCRSEQDCNDSRIVQARLATRVDCVAACLESLVLQANSLASTSQSTNDLLSHITGQQQCMKESVQAHSQSLADVLHRLEATTCSVDTLSRSHSVLQEHSAKVAREFELHCSAMSRSNGTIHSEFERLKEHVTSELARSMCTGRAELEESAASVHAELVASVSSSQAMALATREELMRALEREGAAVRQLLLTQCDRQAEEMGALREDLGSGMSQQSRRSQQLDARVDTIFEQSADELACALRSQGETMAKVHAAMEAELRREVALVEQRTAFLIDESLKRGAELSAGTVEFLAKQALERELMQQQLGNVEHIAKQALADADGAKSRASVTEAMIANLASETRSVGLPDAFVDDVRAAISSLTASIVKVAQCCGFIGGLREGHLERIGTDPPVVYLPAGRIGLTELIEWEGSGLSLASRIERAWTARSSPQSLTLLEALQQKADGASVRMVQAAVRETAGRVAQVQSQDFARQGEVAPCVVSWVQSGEPCVGAAHSRKSKAPAFSQLTPRVAPSALTGRTPLPETPSTLPADSKVEYEERAPEFDSSVAPEPPTERISVQRPAGRAAAHGGPLQRRLASNITTPSFAELLCDPELPTS